MRPTLRLGTDTAWRFEPPAHLAVEHPVRDRFDGGHQRGKATMVEENSTDLYVSLNRDDPIKT